MLVLFSFILQERDYILRFSLILVIYYSLRGFIESIIPFKIKYFKKAVSLGISCGMMYLVPINIINIYSWMILACGFIYKWLEFC